MVPVPLFSRNANAHTTKLLYTLLSIGSQYAQRAFHGTSFHDHTRVLTKRDGLDHKSTEFIVFATLIPVLVLLSGVFAGLTLGYMSLDETQLSVLSISGTPKQREYAAKIMPIRKNGHLLLVTLLLANMIVNETLPVISEPVLGGGVAGVVVSTVLIIIFAEIIPQSICTRHGLYLGAKMAGVMKCLLFTLGIIAWPVAKILELSLGPHHGIIYRRTELKELIALHSDNSPHGGDLKIDTVTIIGATLDLQEKVVKQAMTPIEDVFMLSIDSKLDYDLLKKIVATGHSRVPVYEEIDVPISTVDGVSERTHKVKKILGILLVKQCVLLDPKDAVPLRNIPLNKVPFVPNNEPLLGILDKFQEGRSHMAIVSRFSVEKAMSVKQAAKRSLTQRLRQRVMGDSDSSDEEKDIDSNRKLSGVREVEEATLKEEGIIELDFASDKSSFPKSVKNSNSKARGRSVRTATQDDEKAVEEMVEEVKKTPRSSFQLPRAAASMASMAALEQSMPADAVLGKEGAEQFLKNFDPAVMPLGIITLEDVLEELIGEEIYDEFDPQGAQGDPYKVPPKEAAPAPVTFAETTTVTKSHPPPLYMPTALKSLSGLGFLRSRSAPPEPHEDHPERPPSPVAVSRVEEVPAPIVQKIPTEIRPPLIAAGQSAPVHPDTIKPTNPPGLPTLPLEAVLLDRRRRLVGSVPSGAPSTSSLGASVPSMSRPTGAHPVDQQALVPPARSALQKGTRFKSSPLTEGEMREKDGEKDTDAIEYKVEM